MTGINRIVAEDGSTQLPRIAITHILPNTYDGPPFATPPLRVCTFHRQRKLE